jgi:Eukaryotic initiation factor 4E
MMNDDDVVYLNDIWTLYFHDPEKLDDWTNESYIRITDITTPKMFYEVHNFIKEHLHAGMFFIMREHIFPTWDDTMNKDGGILSLKVIKTSSKDYWEDICVKILGETMAKDESRWSSINGVSISPKKHFCIIKIWLGDAEAPCKTMYNLPENYEGDALFKTNVECMQLPARST